MVGLALKWIRCFNDRYLSRFPTRASLAHTLNKFKPLPKTTKGTRSKLTKVSKKAAQFTESVIREMTRLAGKHKAVNLAQGFPDFPCPEELKIAAARAIDEDYNQYSVTWGAPVLREAISKKAKKYNKIDSDPEKNIVVTCGTNPKLWFQPSSAILDPGERSFSILITRTMRLTR